MSNFSLRPAVETDAPRIRDLIHRVGINPMSLNWKRFVVAEAAGGEFIGCAQLKPHQDGSLELASLAVEEAYRQHGVARRLIEHLLAQSPRPLYLMCRTELGPFYEKFGFHAVETKALPPYFKRVRRLVRIMVFLAGRNGPLIMRLD
jgi:N-acetylglutamate synthase-like GNAT family acetyltransferase